MRKLTITNIDKTSFWQKYYLDFFAALVLALTLFLFFPIAVYQHNIGAVTFNLNDIVLVLLSFTLGSFVISAVLGIIIHKFFYEHVGIIYLCMILGFWIQGNILTYDLGRLDGHAINWSMFRGYYILEFIIWAGLIAVAIWFRKAIYRRLSTVLVLLLIFEIAPLLIVGVEQSSTHQRTGSSLYFVNDHEFEFSADKNVVIIILDTARADAFEQILARNPSYQVTFKDFTFFKNALSGYPTTKPSIPLILTGKYYNNSIPFQQYMEENKKNSLPNLLKANGYAVEYYSFDPYVYPDIWDNTSNKPSYSDLRTATKQLYLVTFLRYLPLPFKPLIVNQYYQGKSYWGRDIVDFYNQSANTSRADKGPVFKLIHLTGMHPPFQLDNSLQYSPDNTYLNLYEGNLLAVQRLLKEMKAAKVYDNSIIFVMGDHGADPWDVQEALGQSSSIMMLHGMPLLLAKGFHQEQSSLAVSNAPVSSGDVPKSVMEALGLIYEVPGLSVFQNIPENRSRTFYYYSWQSFYWNADFLPPLYVFQVDGDVRNPNSWHFKRDAYSDSMQADLLPSFYQYGENIVSESDPYIQFFSSGFVGRGLKGSWATGPSSCIYLLVQKNEGPLNLSFSVTPFLDQKLLKQQALRVLVDNNLVKSAELNSPTSMTIPLSADLTNDQELNLCFEFPDAKYSPKDLGINDNTRHLGGLFESIRVDGPVSQLLASDFNFGADGNSAKIKGIGWSDPEPEFTWVEGHKAQLVLPLALHDTKNIKMTLSAFPLVDGNQLKQQSVIVRSDGHELGQWTMDHEGEYSVDIPSSYIKDGFLTIEFEIPNAASPSSLGISKDARVLGMAVRWLHVEQP